MGSENEFDDVSAADRSFFDALLAADAVALDDLLAPDFLIVDVAAGAVTGRADFLGAVRDGAVRFDEIESFPAEAVVRGYADTVIVVGRTAMTFTAPDGARLDVASRYTHVFNRAGGGAWRLVTAQGTPIT